MQYTSFLIKYAEIAIKGKNRYLFEDTLVRRISEALRRVEGHFTCRKEQGRIYVYADEGYDYDDTVDALRKVFGIVGICPVVIHAEEGLAKMGQDAVAFLRDSYDVHDQTFKVVCRRAKKSFPVPSMEVNAEIGGMILDAFPQMQVDVHDPDLTINRLRWFVEAIA